MARPSVASDGERIEVIHDEGSRYIVMLFGQCVVTGNEMVKLLRELNISRRYSIAGNSRCVARIESDARVIKACAWRDEATGPAHRQRNVVVKQRMSILGIDVEIFRASASLFASCRVAKRSRQAQQAAACRGGAGWLKNKPRRSKI